MTVRQILARLVGAAAAVIACAFVMAQASPASVSIAGNHPAEAAALAGAVRAESTMPLELTLVLGLRNQAALDQLLAEQQNSASPQYRQWLTPAEFNSRFGPTDQQVALITDWLKGEGFEVTSVNRNGRTIQATGDVATAERAFSTTLMSAGTSFGNITDPIIPAQFDGIIVSIMGLDNLHASMPAGLHRSAPSPQSGTQHKLETLALADVSGGSPENAPQLPAATEGGSTAFGPIDLETFYDETPLLNAGNTGSPSPDCIALDEDSDYLPAAVTLYDTTFGMTPAVITNIYPDGSSPGRTADETEVLLDIDYAHATAPGTPLHMYMGTSLYDAISQSVTDGTCGAISISYIFCGDTPAYYTGLDTLFTEAATQGQSVFVATGDWGAAGLQYSSSSNNCVTGTVRNVSEMATSPHVTAVGGTTFAPQFNGSGNDTSVVGVAPGGTESGWDASGGGVSTIFAKPLWQTGQGVPDDNFRDIPDVAMIAWAPYVFIGADNDGTAIIQCCWGGTSLATPLWAGYSRVLAKASGDAHLGLLNPTIYTLASNGLAANGIEDVLGGSNTYNGVTGYTAGLGYDQVTGWGSVNMKKFASAFVSSPSSTPTASSSASATATKTSTPTPTATAATATATRTPATTSTPTRTATPTASATATVSRSATATSTATATATPTATGTPGTSMLNFTPVKIKFGKFATGATSNVKIVTLSNPNKKKSEPITLVGWSIAGDFSVSEELMTCAPAMVLSRGQKCTIGVVFTPTQAGALSGTLTIQDSARNSEQVILLKGTGK
jgi:subtilase family serine protease